MRWKVSEWLETRVTLSMQVLPTDVKLASRGDFTDYLNLKSTAMLKWMPLDHFKMYFGMQFAEDGWTAVIGAKLAGIKIMMPVTGL